MSYSCKILLDSISETGKRLTTFEITFPRIVLSEFNTHRMFSRNSASSRAIPFKKQIERIKENPFIPEVFPIDGKGMQPNTYIQKPSKEHDYAVECWLNIRDGIVNEARYFHDLFSDFEQPLSIHKQLVNRLLEPFMWHTVIVTATEFSNFFKLRCDENAQYEIRRIADLMYEAYHKYNDFAYGQPQISLNWDNISVVPQQKLKVGEWHCPLVYEEDDKLINNYIDLTPIAVMKQQIKSVDNPIHVETLRREIRKQISVARCARVSYLTHDGKRDIEKDLELFERLRTSGHWSPFEHCATPFFSDINSSKELDTAEFKFGWQRVKEKPNYFDIRSGNFIGWKQYRKEFADENCTNFRKENQ